MDNNEIKAKGRFLRFSPYKGRVVAKQIKGKGVGEALQMLKFSQKKGSAPAIYKVLASAVANAENRGDVNVDSLYVKNVIVDGGPIMKRIRFRARGRADRILKHMCHVTVILDQR